MKCLINLILYRFFPTSRTLSSFDYKTVSLCRSSTKIVLMLSLYISNVVHFIARSSFMFSPCIIKVYAKSYLYGGVVVTYRRAMTVKLSTKAKTNDDQYDVLDVYTGTLCTRFYTFVYYYVRHWTAGARDV